MDAEKQDAINVFLGHVQPQQGKPAPWEYNVGRNGQTNVDGDASQIFMCRSIFKRSLSDGNILRGSGSPLSAMNVRQQKFCRSAFPDQFQEENNVLSESSPEISTCESDIAFSRYDCFTFCLFWNKSIVS
ncbi:hypothetical protein NC653_018104 [Populus alba x Populus x berolinensis]|uniref:Uncharacterized protein n=1 Tax=Populus alba x Populus x berolinensis TaxID=444605 RepID=A0AAD6W1C1_9ROSI|nr:hypothetical protein NC653_018104 [Populus alba x Populus x berolinensis]